MAAAQPSAAASGPRACDAAAELVETLPQEHKFALGGLCASLLAKHTEFWSDGWCRSFLHRLSTSMLKLQPEQCVALEPLYETSGGPTVELSAFVDLLPREEHERASVLLALLVLIVTGEDTKATGYDARARQLLCDLAATLQVPWSRLATLERQLAASMRAQFGSGAPGRHTTPVAAA